ncbi:CBS domain-containing protein [Algibacter amylolyticus]|uniref:CBS domain-containing protein n=1 Tax=Algibacter amylolyticus TaxID=1608400 RepID=A0A5M7AX42_9FLAO|nr:CBS domain-containing protein [Algibacter amylolyticus]KAA5820567.1 CBS domain-containing protein [Algibacter amylolyticus]MBB5269974.1 CBS domain-containing protein [Algibacter amylolyticus]TSJ71240.1 CBS domain-containing protein [Algibacter amylolyticus]
MIRKAPISMIMTQDVITLNKTDKLETAEHLFKKYKIRHIPVVNGHVIVGMLSYSDLLRLSFADITNEDESAVDVMVYNMFTIDQVMKRNIVTVSSTSSIKEVAELLASKEFHALPVVDNNTLKGIVTTTDLIKYLLKQF